MPPWITDHRVLLEWATLAAAAVSLVGILIVPWMVVRTPADYFADWEAPPPPWFRAHPAVRALLHVLKNTAGVLLAVAGAAMLVLPGQGLLTLFVAFTLLDFPGKRRLELWLVRRPVVHRLLDWIRRRASRPPLRLPDLGPRPVHSAPRSDDP